MSDTLDRPTLLHCARVYLREARARRQRSPAFAAVLLGWAARARRDAANIRPAQRDLFS